MGIVGYIQKNHVDFVLISLIIIIFKDVVLLIIAIKYDKITRGRRGSWFFEEENQH